MALALYFQFDTYGRRARIGPKNSPALAYLPVRALQGGIQRLALTDQQ